MDKKKGKGGKKGGNDDKGGKKGGKEEKLKTCNFVKARHILCSKQSQIEEIFNKEIPFIPTEDIKRCEYCDYKEICGK